MSPLERRAAQQAEVIARMKEIGSSMWLAGWTHDEMLGRADRLEFKDYRLALIEGWHMSNLQFGLSDVATLWRAERD